MMNLDFKALLVSVAAASSLTAFVSAHADVRGETPWDWPSLERAITKTGSGGDESNCEDVAKNLNNPALKCTMDHASWDKFYEDQMKLPSMKRIESRSPWDCQMSLNFFRNRSNSGHIPSKTDTDGQPVVSELKQKIGTFACVFDPANKHSYITYDPASRTLTFRLTKKDDDNNRWLVDELQRLKSQFPALNQYWDDGHNP